MKKILLLFACVFMCSGAVWAQDEPSADAKGTAVNPYTVAEFLEAIGPDFSQNLGNVWLKGYIVGYASTSYYNENSCKFEWADESKTNVLLADSPEESIYSNTVVVQLPVGAVREGLTPNGENYKKLVQVYGSGETFNRGPGIRNTSDYVDLGSGGTVKKKVNLILSPIEPTLAGSSAPELTLGVEGADLNAVNPFVVYSVAPENSPIATLAAGGKGVVLNTTEPATVTITVSLEDNEEFVADPVSVAYTVYDPMVDIILPSDFEGKIGNNSYQYYTWTSPHSGFSFTIGASYPGVNDHSKFNLRRDVNSGLAVSGNNTGNYLDRVVVEFAEGNNAGAYLELYEGMSEYNYDGETATFPNGDLAGDKLRYQFMVSDDNSPQNYRIDETPAYWGLKPSRGVMGITKITFYYTDLKRLHTDVTFPRDAYEVAFGESFESPRAVCPYPIEMNYSSDNERVAKVEAATGEVTIVGAGNAIITATPAEGTGFYGSASYLLTVKDADANDGSESKPFTVQEYLDAFRFIDDKTEVYVDGFITGYMAGNANPSFGLDGAYDTNFIISDSAEAMDGETPAYIAVDIPIDNSVMRTALGLNKSPENFGRHIRVRGGKGLFNAVSGITPLAGYEWLDRQPEVTLRNGTLNRGTLNRIFTLPADVDLGNVTVTITDAEGTDAATLFNFTDDFHSVTPASSADGHYKLTLNIKPSAPYDRPFLKTYEIRVVDLQAQDLDLNIFKPVYDIDAIFTGDVEEYQFILAYENANNRVALGSQNENNYRNAPIITIRDDKAIVPGIEVEVIKITKESDGLYSLYADKLDKGYLQPAPDTDGYTLVTSPEKATAEITVDPQTGRATIFFGDDRYLQYNSGQYSRFSCYSSSSNQINAVLYALATPVTVNWEFVGDEGAVPVTEDNTVQLYDAAGHTYRLAVSPESAAEYLSVSVSGIRKDGNAATEDDYNIDGKEALLISSGDYVIAPVDKFGNTHYVIALDDSSVEVEITPQTHQIAASIDNIDVEWSDNELLTSGYNNLFKVGAELADKVTLEIVPAFEPQAGEYNGNDDLYFEFEPSYTVDDAGNVSLTGVQFPCSGLYMMRLVSTANNLAFDSERITLNVYPSHAGLTLSYQSNTQEGDMMFGLESNEIAYRFEFASDIENSYFENTLNPTMAIDAKGVEVWYRLHGLDEVTVPAEKREVRRAVTEPSSLAGYVKVENGALDLSRLAHYDGTSAEMSLVLLKNGAATPLLDNDSDDPKSVQLVTIVKQTSDITGIDSIDNNEEEIEIYNLNGLRVSPDNLSKGIYIVRKGKRTYKVVY